MFKAFEFCLLTNATKVPAGHGFTKSSTTVSASALSVTAIRVRLVTRAMLGPLVQT
jgi:hypothetical protein